MKNIYSVTITFFSVFLFSGFFIFGTPAISASCPLAPGAYKASDSPAVYQVNSSCTKQAFADRNAFFERFSSWHDITHVNAQSLEAIPDGTPFLLEATNTNCPLTPGQAYKSADGPAVYQITSQCTKQAFADKAAFLQHFSSWHDVHRVDSALLTTVTDDANFLIQDTKETTPAPAAVVAVPPVTSTPNNKPSISLPPLPPEAAQSATSTNTSTNENATNNTTWKPSIGQTIQIQYEGKLDETVPADIYDIDGLDSSAALISNLHAKGRRVFCYIDVGTWENWRDDKKSFPVSVLGKSDSGWSGERWLDIRQLNIVQPIMKKRFEIAKDKGCDGIDPDNMDGFDNKTGFSITAADQLKYNAWIAEAVHQLGMSVGLKNDETQVASLLPDFDWSLIEDCSLYGWCANMKPFVAEGKPVFQIEYTDSHIALTKFCPTAKADQFTAILKHRSLDSWIETCN